MSQQHPSVSDPVAYYTAQYNTRADAAYAQATLDRWTAQGQQIRRTNACLLDAPFGDSARQRVDYFPCSQANAPLLVFIHGGWWRFLSKSDFSWVAPAFVAAGFNVAITDYDLCPNVSLKTIVEQQLKAVAYIYDQADRWGFDAKRMHIAGHSAGGHLGGMMCAADFSIYRKGLPRKIFQSATLISGVYDLSPLRHIAAAQADLRLTATDIATLTAAAYSAPSLPIMACAGGLESDDFKRQNTVLHAAWGSNVAVSQIAGCDHFTIVDAWSNPSHDLHKAALSMMREA